MKRKMHKSSLKYKYVYIFLFIAKKTEILFYQKKLNHFMKLSVGIALQFLS